MGERSGYQPTDHDIVDDMGHKVDANFSYAKKEAVAKKESTDKMARLARLTGAPGDFEGLDILHKEAIDYDTKRDKFLADFENKHSTLSLNNVPEEFRGDKSIVLAALRKGSGLSDVSREMRDDQDCVMAAIEQNAYNLRYASERMRGIPEVVSAAVTKDGFMLEYASDTMKDNKEVVLLAIQNSQSRGGRGMRDGGAIQFVSSRLKEDIDVVLAATELDPKNIEHASVSFRTELERLKKQSQ